MIFYCYSTQSPVNENFINEIFESSLPQNILNVKGLSKIIVNYLIATKLKLNLDGIKECENHEKGDITDLDHLDDIDLEVKLCIK